MDWEYYKNFLISNLNGKLASGGKEIICKCQNPSCDDHYRTKEGGHFYISIPQNNDEVSKFNCFKCGYKGIVTHEILAQWGLVDKDLYVELSKYNSSISKKPNKNSSYISYRLYNNYISPNDISKYKLSYINNRLGTNLSFQDTIDLKICINLIDIINSNNLYFTRDINIIESLSYNFVGFISLDNSYVNLRKCTNNPVYESIDKRYINYKLFNPAYRKNYLIPTTVNLNNIVKIHISEGAFDVLSIYLNCRNKEPGIYVSITGNTYSDIINYIISTYMIPYSEIHLYPDNDKFGTNEYIKNQLKFVLDPYIPVYIHRNICEGEKDFGVPKDRIKESIIKLK